MIAYASRTGTRRNLAVLRRNGWRLFVSARGPLRHEGFAYALDNGAWTAHRRGEVFDVPAFEHAYAMLGAGADFVVAPDIVGNGYASLELTRAWLPRLVDARRVLIAVQDGMGPFDVSALVGPRVGVFLGGTTEWKLKHARAWGTWCRARGAYYHVGRVNSAKRIRLCQEVGADSFDGSAASRFAVTARRLGLAASQLHLNRGQA